MDYIGDYTKLQEGPYVHCQGTLNKANSDSSSYDGMKLVLSTLDIHNGYGFRIQGSRGSPEP